jgi:predicted RecB family nuclease
MQKIAEQIFYSATDLTHFADCEHLTWLDRLNLDAPMEKADDDDQAKLIQDLGYAHEAAFLAKLTECHSNVASISAAGSLQERVANTQAAIAAGAEVIYQATLARGNLIGHADFLIRVGDADKDGRHQYEVVDTKLARSSKAKFILQLCFYSDLLSDLTGQLPRHIHVELGNGKRETFRLADYFHYYRHLLGRMLTFTAAHGKAEAPYPAPCDFCSLCRWRERCSARRESDDHLSAVANITRQQISRLEAGGIRKVAQLAALATDAAIPKLADATLAKLREQAALQVEERETGQQSAVVLPIAENEIRGFARLPESDIGDLFFDMEGDPMEVGGLEYLFGLYYFDEGKAQFKCFWAHSREAERQAFIEFMDFVAERRARYPGMHIYHYAHYENTALKRLMTVHGVCESEFDQLLREGRLVDLYKVVREGLRISKPSYSIKAVESFYAEKRVGEVKKATDSIVVYERWRELGDPALLESIRQYNEDDCRSTWQLREWLLSLRPAGLPWFSATLAEVVANQKPARQKSDKTIEHEEKLAQFYRRLVTHPENRALAPEHAELIYHVLDFHRRADKPAWWALFDRQGADLDDLLDNAEVVAGLHSPAANGGPGQESGVQYRFPEQDFKVKAGDPAKRLDTLKDVSILAIDEDEQTIDLKFSPRDEADIPASLSISMGAPFDSSSIRRALFVFAESAVGGQSDYKSLLDYLSHRIPDIVGIRPGDSIIPAGDDALPQIIQAAEQLNDSYLFIQGPPGSGKTYTGSHLIATLLKAGKRVAVSSNSHKAINNLLEAVDKRMKDAGCSYDGMKKSAKPEQCIESDFIENVADAVAIIENRPQLVAGTVYLLCKPEFHGDFDYLFIDEAGQVSLANLIALGMCAKNLILLGDQMQLGQPIQGDHPGRSGESALDYLLDGEATIAPERGVFLEKTYRMHPDVCRFISDAIYDSRLHSDSSTFGQCLVLDARAHPALKPTGIRYVPVEHDGCSQRSEEEGAVVKQLVDNLLTQHYRNKDGETKSITLADILIVAPYNMQVNLLKRSLPQGARVGTVDKFQGQEAEVVIVSMATSSQEYLPRNIEFLFSTNRMNVATSRARCLSLLLCSPRLLDTQSRDTRHLNLLNTFLAGAKYGKD